jgi:tetratricopeptide (TPR) repeat protein
MKAQSVDLAEALAVSPVPTNEALLLNPYVAGGALNDPSGRGFYGREDVFAFIRSALASVQRTPILLYGHRRIGKSSILRQLPNHLPPDFVCVYFDLQGKAAMELDGVLFGVARAIADALAVPRPSEEDAREHTFGEKILGKAAHLLGGRLDRLVLLFDEFDVIDERIAGANAAARRFMGFLADLMSHDRRPGYIFVVGRKSEELSEELNSRILKDCLQMRIGRLDRERTFRLIQKPAEMVLQFTEHALRRIYDLTAGHPFCTQALCWCIWSGVVSGTPPQAVEVDEAAVDAALLPAIDQAQNGLNWIYDGLSEPAHRLWLSAMAAVEDARTGRGAEPFAIDMALREAKIAVDSGMTPVVRDLERWDVITSSSKGYRFTVPMIGLWIRLERPLLKLEREARFANPRAFKYYETAVEAYEKWNAKAKEELDSKKELEAAISDYRRALEANPVFPEAMVGLATALRARREPGDLVEAVEVYERNRDLDANASPGALLQALVETLDDPAILPAQFAKNYDRIKLLDREESQFLPRAQRALHVKALQLQSRGYYRAAHILLQAVPDKRAMARSALLMGVWASCFAVLFGTMSFVLGLVVMIPDFFVLRIAIPVRLLLGAVAGAMFVPLCVTRLWRAWTSGSLLGVLRSVPKRRLTIVTFASVVTGFCVGYLLNWQYDPSGIGAVFSAYVIALVVQVMITDLAHTGTSKSRGNK